MCDHSGSISPYYTTLYKHSASVFYSCLQFLKQVTCLFKMCQTFSTRSAYSSSYKNGPVGQILQPSSGCNVFEETLCLHRFFEGLFISEKKTISLSAASLAGTYFCL